MRDDFLKEARSIASRLDLEAADSQSRRIAEQDMRALGFRFMGRALRAGIASLRQHLVRTARPAPQGGGADPKSAPLQEWQV